MIAKRKASKDDKLRADVMALKEMDRIKIRNSSGAFEVSLVKVYCCVRRLHHKVTPHICIRCMKIVEQ